MPWWGILIIVAVAVLAAVIITYLLARRSNVALRAAKELAEARADTTAKKLEAERATKDQLAAESKALVARLREVDAWYEKARHNITKERRNAFENLATDPDALDRKLDELLATEDDTKPGDQEGPADEG
jgi:hypothetical protein